MSISSADQTSSFESAHYIHPYPGTMAPRVARELLDKVPTRDSASVLDPFTGAGGVLVEAAVRGLSTEGWDANPLACLISRVKLTPVRQSAVSRMSGNVVSRARKLTDPPLPDVVNVDYWYHPHVRDGLAKLAAAISEHADGPTRDLLSLALSRTAMQLSLANPRFQVPVRIRPEKYPEDSPIRQQLEARLAKIALADPVDLFAEAVSRMVMNLARLHCLLRARHASSCVRERSVLDPWIEGGREFDMILTSPPYPGAQKYSRFSSLSLGWLGLAATDELSVHEARLIGREHFRKKDALQPPALTGIDEADRLIASVYEINSVRAHIGSTYLVDMRNALERLDGVISDQGLMHIVVGPSQFLDHVFDTPTYLTSIAEEFRFRLKERVDDPIRNRRLMTARNRKIAAIQYEALLTFERYE